jgi:hypothetical protein
VFTTLMLLSMPEQRATAFQWILSAACLHVAFVLVQVQMFYVGRLKSNGKVFDQTKGNKTFNFRLGEFSYRWVIANGRSKNGTICAVM